jgi:uncharacterized protein
VNGARARILPDGRLHLQHGPIDLILQAEGPGAAGAHARAAARFEGLLEELVAELPLLRRPVGPGPNPLQGPIARRMWQATAAHAPAFVTPMAAVAGAVAEAVLAAMVAGPGIIRAYVNNGGDIALHLAPAASHFRVGLVVDPARPAAPGHLTIPSAATIRGIATSGRHGRSLSLGIADSVTALARSAPEADVAATLIANAVDLPGDPAVSRAPAQSLHPDSDLGARLVTVGVAPLDPVRIGRALDAGTQAAQRMIERGLILGAVLVLGAHVRLLGEATLVAPRIEFEPAGALAHA